jgi:hypothetical protein
MKKNIIQLIKDDIKISRLVGTLERLDVSANKYYLGNSIVIFSLLGIIENDQNTELYNKLIEQGEDLKKYDSIEKVEELAEVVYKQLMVF